MEVKIDVELKRDGNGGDGEGRGRVLYCPLCRARGERVRMRPGKLLIRSPHAVLQPRPWFVILQRWLRWAVELPPIARFIARHERWFYRLYFAPYRRVDGYLCEAIAGHGLTRETYLKALLGEASPAAIFSEMEEIQAAYREQLWSGLH